MIDEVLAFSMTAFHQYNWLNNSASLSDAWNRVWSPDTDRGENEDLWFWHFCDGGEMVALLNYLN